MEKNSEGGIRTWQYCTTKVQVCTFVTEFIIERVSFSATRSRCGGQSQRGQTDRSRSMRLLPATGGTLSHTERDTCGDAAELIRECKSGLAEPRPFQRVPELTFAKGWHTLAGFFGRVKVMLYA